MKNIRFYLVLILSLTIVHISSAQTDKGNMIVGGSLALDFDKDSREVAGNSIDFGNTTTLILSPTVGYFVIDGLVLGAEVSFQRSKFKPDQGDGESTSSLFTFGPFAKYYLDNGLFGMATMAFGSGKSEFNSDGFSGESKIGIFSWRVGAGYAAFLNDNVSIEPMLSYGSLRREDKDADLETFDFDKSFTISVGFTIFL